MKRFLLGFFTLWFVASCLYADNKNVFFRKKYDRITGSSDLIKVRFPKVVEKDKYLSNPSYLNMLALLETCSENTDTQRVFQLIDLDTRRIVYCKTSITGITNELLQDWFLTAEKNIPQQAKKSELAFKFYLPTEDQKNFKVRFLISKTKEQLLQKNILVLDNEHIEEILFIHKHYFSQPPTTIMRSQYQIELRFRDKKVEIWFIETVAGNKIISQTFDDTGNMDELAKQIADLIATPDILQKLKSRYDEIDKKVSETAYKEFLDREKKESSLKYPTK
jgi:hypothetical protein